MEDSNESQNVVHFLISPLNGRMFSFGSLAWLAGVGAEVAGADAVAGVPLG